MRARLKVHGRSSSSSARLQALLLTVSVGAPQFGCNAVANLQEHQPYLGFPDSPTDVPCSTGSIEISDMVVDPGISVPCRDAMFALEQDGHRTTSRPTYEPEGAYVRDSITGLVWSTQALAASEQKEAQGKCQSIGADFRVPSRLELASLLDYGAKDALIDSNTFQGVTKTPYYTSTDYPNTDPQYDNSHWAVYFGAPESPEIMAPHAGEVLGMHDGTDAGVLCVKEDSGPFVSGPFVPVKDATQLLLDTRTGLVWMKSPLPTTSWRDALIQCAKKSDGNHSDFRLPNAKELATLIDDSLPQANPLRIFKGFSFLDMPYLWSSTPASDPTRAFALSTSGASIAHWRTELSYYEALCVRGPD